MSRKKSPPPSPIAGVIKATIRERGLTAYRVSKMSGVTIDSIQRFLNGERGLSLASADKLAHALGLELRPVAPTAETHVED
jgi:transcriptional regulator with XRE-family HTH domain